MADGLDHVCMGYIEACENTSMLLKHTLRCAEVTQLKQFKSHTQDVQRKTAFHSD